MKRRLIMSAVAATAALALAACGTAPEETPEPTAGGDVTEEATDDAEAPPAEEVDFLGCMVSDAGGWDDQSFNQTSFAGLQRAAAELGIEMADAESTVEGDFAPNVDSMVQQGCSQIIGVGFLLAPAIQAAAEANTDVQFALVDSGFDPAVDNGKALIFNTAEAAYLAGYVAAGMTESGTVATFGGLLIPSVNIFMDGFSDGIDKYNEDNGTSVELLGWDKAAQDGASSGGFDDQTQGQTLAEQFIAQGADIIMPVAGPVGLGAAAAARDAGAKIIWVDTDGYESTSYGDIILTSVMKKMDEAVFESLKAGLDGTFDNTPYIGTLENEGVDIAPFHDFDDAVPAELKAKVDELRQAIISGEIVVETVNAP